MPEVGLGFGFGVLGFWGFGVLGFWGFGFWVLGLGFRVWRLRFGVSDFWTEGAMFGLARYDVDFNPVNTQPKG